MTTLSLVDKVLDVCSSAGSEIATLSNEVQKAYLANPALLEKFDTRWSVDEILVEMEKLASSIPAATTSQKSASEPAADLDKTWRETAVFFQSEALGAILNHVKEHVYEDLGDATEFDCPAWASMLAISLSVADRSAERNKCTRLVFQAARELGELPNMIIEHFIDIEAIKLLSFDGFLRQRIIGIQTPVKFVEKISKAADDDLEKLLAKAMKGLLSLPYGTEMSVIAIFMNTRFSTVRLTLDSIKGFASRSEYPRRPANTNINAEQRDNLILHARNAIKLEVEAYQAKAAVALEGLPLFLCPDWHKDLVGEFADIQYGRDPISRKTGAIVDAVFGAAEALSVEA